MLQTELAAVPLEVLSQLPEWESLKKTIRPVRRKYLSSNSTSLAALKNFPERYERTLTGEKFLIFNSRPEDFSDDEDHDEDATVDA